MMRRLFSCMSAITIAGAMASLVACTPDPQIDTGGGSGGGSGGNGAGSGGSNLGGGSGGLKGSGGGAQGTGGSTGTGGGTGAATGGATAAGGGSAGNGAVAGTGGVVGTGGVTATGTGGFAGAGTGAGGAGGRSATGGAGGTSTGLVHPGGFFTQADMDRVRSNVAAGREPWASAWAALRTSGAGVNSQPSVTATITDSYAIQNQGHMAYVLAVKWMASGDLAYATAAKRVLDGWVNTVTSLQTTTLRTGIGAVQMANAAEIVAHGFDGAAGWPPAQVTKARTWFRTVVWPVIGQANAQRSSNWGTAAMAGCMATAIFADDRSKFEYTVDAYKHGFRDAPDGCSGVTQYICEPTGQPIEAGRDQGHPQGGVAHLVEVALMAWNQSTNLVTYADNRLVAGMEYLAKYNLNMTVPYNGDFADPCNIHPVWTTISPVGRGSFSPVYEMASRVYGLAGIAHPFTMQVLSTPGYQPEKTNSDHPGSGTLLFR